MQYLSDRILLSDKTYTRKILQIMEKFLQLSCHERQLIYRGLCDERSITEIARSVGRALSTISREIKQNSDHIGYLYPEDAHAMAQKRRRKYGSKIENDAEL